MCAEVGAELGEVSCFCRLLSDGLEIILRTCHGHKEVDGVVNQEGGEHNETIFLEARLVEHQRQEYGEEYHGIVGKISHVEEFAPESRS